MNRSELTRLAAFLRARLGAPTFAEPVGREGLLRPSDNGHAATGRVNPRLDTVERALLGVDAYLQMAEEHPELPSLLVEEQRVLALWQDLQDIASEWADHPDHPFPPPRSAGPVSLAGQRRPKDVLPCGSSAPSATCHRELRADGVLVYTMGGDLDMSAADALTFDSPLDAVRAVVVDLASVTFFDSTGLNALLHLRAAALKHALTVHLAAVPAQTARVLDITDVTALFPTHPSREAALAAIGTPD
ncbi:STAS domain-containing protein [Streptacidiphilus jiangxiensis]|uniref:Anti-anti-sigma factor n=1 Tax=Streptacidiphilus jiangxiensis TaxID=235985 RepID=A0A1H7HBE6_STRJI|nr:STAS domain-containing protein [Streptacidiphilus jiangxiensis]SEK47528.1 anti-anti-sigma factor [Streptacidiphilus jiangxiensis]